MKKISIKAIYTLQPKGADHGEASLTRTHLEGEAGKALCRVVSEAVSLVASLRLALVRLDKELFNPPWETMLISGEINIDEWKHIHHTSIE